MYKPKLDELIAAVNGVICAGIGAAKTNPNYQVDPLYLLGQKATGMSIDAKGLYARRLPQDAIAKPIVSFLEDAICVLQENPEKPLMNFYGHQTGRVQDVINHIVDIAQREQEFSWTKRETVNLTSLRASAAGYLSDYKPAKSETVSADFEQSAYGTVPKKRKGGRPKTKAIVDTLQVAVPKCA